jgi:MFS family permease
MQAATSTAPQATSPDAIPASVHPLRLPAFRRLWAGSAISLAGDQFYLVALPWVVLQLTGSAVAMGTILMTAAIPRAVLMLMGGALTDRFSSRRILMSTASARAVVVGIVGALLWFGALQVWHLYALGFAFGVADAFAMPAGSALMPTLVARDQLVRANSVMQTTSQLTTIAGPAPAGLVIRSLGAAAAFIVDAISFLFVIVALWSLPEPAQAAARPRGPMWRAVLDGIASVRQDAALSALMLLAAMINVCVSGPLTVGLAVMAKTAFGSPAAYGFIVSSLAAGGLIGALLAGVWKVKHRGPFLLITATLIGVCVIALGFLADIGIIAGVLALMAAASALTNIHLSAWIQGRVNPATRGRVLSVLMLAAVGLMPVSLAAAGFLAAWSLKGMFVVAGAAMLTVTAFAATRQAVRGIA